MQKGGGLLLDPGFQLHLLRRLRGERELLVRLFLFISISFLPSCYFVSVKGTEGVPVLNRCAATLIISSDLDIICT